MNVLNADSKKPRATSSMNGVHFRIHAEQLRMRMSMYPYLILVQMAVEPLFVWMFWNWASHDLLLMWLAICYATHVFELVIWAAHRSALSTAGECRAWHIRFTVFAVVTGLLWGWAAFVFFPGDIAYQSLLICVMLGLVAGAVTMNPVHPPALYGYVTGIMGPLMMRVAMDTNAFHWILLLMLSLFTALVLLAGRNLHRAFMHSLVQRFENIELLQQLSEQKDETEEAKRCLELANEVLRDSGSRLEEMVNERTAELLRRTQEVELIQDTAIIALSSLAETRDNETGNHIRRTQNYVRSLAMRLRDHSRFADYLSDENITLLYKVAPLHDVGKVGIPDHILHKPGKLTVDEFEIMKTHALLGGQAIAAAERTMEGLARNSFLMMAREIAAGHHEKWDGSGYPMALRGDDIPIPARLMALADVYDALACRRVYKAAMCHEAVVATIVEGKGKHFDPDVVDAFVDIHAEFQKIAEVFSDENTGAGPVRMAA